MKNFWPHRAKARGFSIENLALTYREKISGISSNQSLDRSLDDRNLKSINEDSKTISVADLSIKRGHWANRDFSEYNKVA